MNKINPGTIVLYNGPEEGELHKDNKLLVLMSRHAGSNRILVQVMSGQLIGHIIYLPARDIRVDEVL